MNTPERLQSILSGFQEHLPEWALTVVTLFLAVVTTIVVRQTVRERRERARAVSFEVRIKFVKEFNPELIVGAYGNGTDAYLSIDADIELASILAARQDVLITGRPGIGKSHAAIEHIKKAFPKWRIVHPGRNALQAITTLSFESKRYVLLLDDLDDYAAEEEGMMAVLDAVKHIRRFAKQVVVVATVRSTAPEFDFVTSSPKVFAKWKVVELSDWKLTQAQALAVLTGTSLASWDGTPLSIKKPSSEMQVRYRNATAEVQQILGLIKTLHDYGIRPIRVQLLTHLIGRAPEQIVTPATIRVALKWLKHSGFLKPEDSTIEAYEPYLEFVRPHPVGPDVQPLVELLCELHLVPELVRLALHFADGRSYQQAVEILEKAVALEPLQERLHYRLGIVLARQKKWHEAAAKFARATELSPGWASAWSRLGAVLAKQGLKNKASDAFAQAATASRLDLPALRCLRIAGLREAGHFEEALREIDDLIVGTPQSAMIWFEKGRVLAGSGQNRESVEAFREALRLEPMMAEAHYGIARPLREIGDTDGSVAAYRKAMELNRWAAGPHSFLATILMDLGQHIEAETEHKAAIALSPLVPEYHSYYAQFLGKVRRPVEMEKEFREALRLRPNYPEALIGLGAVLRWQKRTKEAIDANTKAIELDDSNASAHFGLGRCALNTYDSAAAERHFRRAIGLDNRIGAAHYYLGVTLLILHKPEEAIEALRNAEDLKFNRGSVRWQLAKCFASLGFAVDSMKAIDEAVSARFSLDISRLETDGTFQEVRSHPDWPAFIADLAARTKRPPTSPE